MKDTEALYNDFDYEIKDSEYVSTRKAPPVWAMREYSFSGVIGALVSRNRAAPSFL